MAPIFAIMIYHNPIFLKIMRLNDPETPSKNVKGPLITRGDRRFRGDFVVGNLGGYLLFQADGNVVHWDVFGSTRGSTLPFTDQLLPFTG